MNVDRAAAQKNESENVYAGLIAENHEIEKQLQEINDNKAKISEEIEYVKNRESQIEEENKNFQQILDAKSADVESATNAVSQVTLELAGIRQKAEFVMENLTRIQSEIRRFDDEREGVLNEAKNAKADVVAGCCFFCLRNLVCRCIYRFRRIVNFFLQTSQFCCLCRYFIAVFYYFLI